MNAPAGAAVPLAARQQALQARLLRDGAVEGIVARDTAQRQARLRLYADAYRLRLAEVLGNDFPVLRALLGDAAFQACAFAYLDAHPSRTPSVRWCGAGFADWLAQRDGGDRALVAVARFEWAQGEVFDAADAPVCTIADLAALPAAQWPGLRLRLHPALRRLRLAGNAAALVDAQARGMPLPAPAAGEPAHWLLWRVGFDVHWRRLDDDEAAALAAVAHDASFADCCALLDGDAPALRAAGLLKRWLDDGLVVALVPAPPAHPS
jgi:hypothetical protein